MRKPIAILLLGLSLLTNLELYQFIKLPVLIEHFHEHKAINPKMTFWDFWNLHYNSNHPQDADYRRDQQLPFQTSDIIQQISSGAFILPQVCNVCISIDLTEQTTYTYYPGFIPEYCSTDIFQPPRFVKSQIQLAGQGATV